MLLLATVWLTALAALSFDDTLWCFDRGPECDVSEPPAAWLLSRGIIWAAVLGVGVLAIVVAWRRRRGLSSRLTTLIALAGPLLAVLAASRIVAILLL